MSGVIREIVVEAKCVADSVAPGARRRLRGSRREAGTVWRCGVWGVEGLDLEMIGRSVDGEPERTTQPGVALHFLDGQRPGDENACQQQTEKKRWIGLSLL
jgi:hypothetical protein